MGISGSFLWFQGQQGIVWELEVTEMGTRVEELIMVGRAGLAELRNLLQHGL